MSTQQAHTLDKKVTVHVKRGLPAVPPEGYGKADKKWPLILFLHGAGERATTWRRSRSTARRRSSRRRRTSRSSSSRRSARRRGLEAGGADALLDEVVAEYEVDPDRVYLTGLSMGGFGTWALAAALPRTASRPSRRSAAAARPRRPTGSSTCRSGSSTATRTGRAAGRSRRWSRR